MKVLIVTSGYFPGKKFGGPPVSINNLCNLLNEIEFYIVTKNHDMHEIKKYNDIKDGWNKRYNASILYLSDKEYNMKNFERAILEVKPDIIYLQSLFQNCVIPCLMLAKKYNIKILLAPRGELCKGAFKKKYKKIPYILFLRTIGLIDNIFIQSTSDEETKMVIKYLKIHKERIYYLTNVPTVSNIKKEKKEKKAGEANFVFLSRIVPKKNLLFALECLQNVCGKVKLDIYGTKENLKYWNECEKEILRLPNNIKVEYCGIASHENVCQIFSKYDAFLFPTLSENFGHVIAESLSVGCPVIISDQTPFRDLRKNKAGVDIELENIDEFVNEINKIIMLNNFQWNKMSKDVVAYFYKKLEINKIKFDYITAFNNMIKKRDNKINVLIVPSWYDPNPNNQRGSFFREQAKALKKYGINVVVADLSFQGKDKIFNKNNFHMRKIIYEDEPVTYSYTMPSLRIPTLFPRFASIIAEKSFSKILKQLKKENINIDIIHIHSFVSIGAGVSRIAKKNGIPVVLTEHYSGIISKKLSKTNIKLFRETIDNSNVIIAVSEGLKKSMNDYLDKKRKIYVIPNMVNNKFYRINQKDKKEFVFISVGNLVESKRFDLTINSFSEFLKKNDSINLKLKIIGDGPKKKELKKLVNYFEIDDKVEFLGQIPRMEVIKEMQKSDVFILPSDYETFGVVYIEALSCGLPLIATKNGGAEDIIKNYNGLLFEKNNEEELVKAMNIIYTNYNEYDKEYISRQCIKEYGEKSVCERIIELYSKILKDGV